MSDRRDAWFTARSGTYTAPEAAVAIVRIGTADLAVHLRRSGYAGCPPRTSESGAVSMIRETAVRAI